MTSDWRNSPDANDYGADDIGNPPRQDSLKLSVEEIAGPLEEHGEADQQHTEGNRDQGHIRGVGTFQRRHLH